MPRLRQAGRDASGLRRHVRSAPGILERGWCSAGCAPFGTSLAPKMGTEGWEPWSNKVIQLDVFLFGAFLVIHPGHIEKAPLGSCSSLRLSLQAGAILSGADSSRAHLSRAKQMFPSLRLQVPPCVTPRHAAANFFRLSFARCGWIK